MIKIPERDLKTLTFQEDVPIEVIYAAIDRFFAEEEYEATLQRELKQKQK